jgi:cytochrome c peroxidase
MRRTRRAAALAALFQFDGQTCRGQDLSTVQARRSDKTFPAGGGYHGVPATGRWADIGKFRVPSLRGRVARTPYFHDGTAEHLEAVVAFYGRSAIGLSLAERDDRVAFLRAL